MPTTRARKTRYSLSVFLAILVLACSTAKVSGAGENAAEKKFLTAGLVDVQTVDPTIRVKLVNSDSGDNYFGEDFYDGLEKAYLQKPVAKKLARAQKILKKKHPTYSLLIMDAARPHAVSVAMYEKMKGTRFEKYVANPKRGSMHNYGAAVDLTIVDGDGDLLDMGFIPFYKSKIGVALSYLFSSKDKLSKDQRANRTLLKRVMLTAGFKPLSHEWWHFNGFEKKVIRKRFRMIK